MRFFLCIKNSIVVKNIKSMKNIIIKTIIGFIAGIISGLFGTGGGMIIVPAFIYLLNMKDRNSRATSIFCILPMVITSSFFYYKGNYINWRISILCAIGGVIGGIAYLIYEFLKLCIFLDEFFDVTLG